MPDAFIFALGGTVLIGIAALFVDADMRANPLRLVDAWGSGFWSLIPFTLQMTMMIIGGYVLATSPAVFRVIASPSPSTTLSLIVMPPGMVIEAFRR